MNIQFHFRLLVTTSHGHILKAVMYVVHRSDTLCDAASRYSVSYRRILDIATKLESIQEEQDTPLVESDNQQHIFRWFRNNINLPLVQGQTYTEWELHQACKIIILDKSSYSDILEIFGVPKSTLTYFLNSIFLPLKCSSLKHLWGIMGFDKTTKRIVREVIEK